jgi:acetylornithine/succinyldiaminopimelate/putrescine aminotransferase|tara:strand:- start:1870 stop:3057 length:1188 start_codon:yes stop_codon:yes gene_type:complete
MKRISTDIFKKYQAQTFPYPSLLEVEIAEGSYITDVDGKKYLDFIAGVSACSIGHSNMNVINAVKDQIDKYSHVMVYGEYIQKPQYTLAKLLAENLPEKLSTTYFTNSGTEAIEGAIKLAKRINGRSEIISCKNSYHGSTHGSLSLMGNEQYKAQYRPLLPDCNQIIYNDIKSLERISEKTSAVIIESIQGASGFIIASQDFLKKLNSICKKNKVLIIFDEIQTCFGRTGTLFGFQQTDIIPDIMCIAKGMGGGMPIGAFISSWDNMNKLTFNPKLGHITTFGGHPINCAASKATLQYILSNKLIDKINDKEKLFKSLLKHKKIKSISGRGLMLSIDLKNGNETNTIVENCRNDGLLLFYFLFNTESIRITPPLTISEKEIKIGCEIILRNLDKL